MIGQESNIKAAQRKNGRKVAVVPFGQPIYVRKWQVEL